MARKEFYGYPREGFTPETRELSNGTIVAPKGNEGSELAGYYGERVVLHAQTLGLNTCWVGLTFKNIKTAYTVAPGEELKAVISLGYGAT